VARVDRFIKIHTHKEKSPMKPMKITLQVGGLPLVTSPKGTNLED
jgi:hypothetical protein